ncbi:hypothetical protein AFLA_010701 [Aspergillus flavus NRRL3357]|nr:hypothetical protein AFLA_010701 [Aspergillus flavus NRRL3357]
MNNTLSGSRGENLPGPIRFDTLFERNLTGKYRRRFKPCKTGSISYHDKVGGCNLRPEIGSDRLPMLIRTIFVCRENVGSELDLLETKSSFRMWYIKPGVTETSDNEYVQYL